MAIAFLGWPALTDAPSIMKQVQTEFGMMTNVFGKEETHRIAKDGNQAYKAIFHDSGMFKSINDIYVTSESISETGKVLPASNVLAITTNNYWLTFSANVYRMALRVYVLGIWFPYILPFLLAVFIDGGVLRRIKLATYGYMSPMRYSLGMHLVIATTFFPLLYLVAPIPVSPYFPPYWALMMALPSVLMLSNVQRMASD